MAWTELCYEYDGSFNGLLCCIFDSYTRRETPVSIRTAEQGQLSLEPVHTVETVASHAKRITKSLQARTPRALPLIQKAYLTCLPDKELYIYRLVQKLYREGPSFLKNPTRSGSLSPAHCRPSSGRRIGKTARFHPLFGI